MISVILCLDEIDLSFYLLQWLYMEEVFDIETRWYSYMKQQWVIDLLMLCLDKFVNDAY